ncbi:MAG: HAMP domain-containing sensor histidine kinase [Aeromicrobium erythreum]
MTEGEVDRAARTRRDPGALRRQMVVLAGALAAFLGIVLVLLVQAIVEDSTTTAADRVLRDRAQQVVTSIDPRGGESSVAEGSLGPGVVVYDGAGRLVAGAVPPALADDFAALSRVSGPRSTESDAGDGYRLLGEPFDRGPGGVVVVAERLAPYEADESEALWLSVAAVLTLVLVAVVLVAWASRRALAPVAEMARTAEEWGAHDLDRRFDLGPPSNEIRLLAHTLDGLLERVGRAIRDEQRLSAELAHELRTPLTALRATAELAAERGDLDPGLQEDLADIMSAAREMTTSIEVLIDIARGDGGSATSAVPLRGVVEDLVAFHRSGRGTPDIDVEVPDDLVVLVPSAVVKRAVGPVVDNATRHGDAIRVVATTHGGSVRIGVVDDGSGVDPRLVDTIFLPGASGSGGSGLGLALARRVARAVGGDLELDHASSPTVFVVTLPGGAAARSSSG